MGKDLGSAMEGLTKGLTEDEKTAIVNFERVLSLIFNRQFSWGTPKCYALRKAIVDFYLTAKARGKEGR